MSDLTTPVLQFGTSRFLQAHADLFFAEATSPKAVTVVQSSGDASRAKRLTALADPAGYPVRIRGIMEGEVLDEERRITSVRRALSTATQWQEVVRVFCDEVSIVISNTGDGGYDPKPRDTETVPHQEMSYPAKLFHLLAARFARNATQLTIMPMELLHENGRVLKARVLEIGRAIGAEQPLLSWVEGLPFANSLVDRIVSEPIEPVGAVAEPYALWAIEIADGVEAPCDHPSVQMVRSIEEIERQKLHILNLGHTALADNWMRENMSKDLLVRQLMDAPLRAKLDDIYAQEVLPGFAAMGFEDEAIAYLTSTIERFSNPFLDHKIADIAQNHAQKIERRIGAFLDWTDNTGVAMPKLRAIRDRARS